MDRWIARFKSCLYSHVGVEDIKISLFFTWFFALFAYTIVNKCDITRTMTHASGNKSNFKVN